MGEKLVSIIIPTFNRERTIMRALESVLHQTYKYIEVIVVDDCSTDSTMELLSTVSDKRLKIIKLDKNQGACVARNRGIEVAKGDYIAFQDSDDIWIADKLRQQVIALQENNADVVFCQALRKRVRTSSYQLVPCFEKSRIIERDVLQGKSIVSNQMILAKRECFQTEIFDTLMPRYQDYDLVIRLAEKYVFYYLAEPLVHIIVQNDSISNKPEKGVEARKIMLIKYAAIIKRNRTMKITMLESLFYNQARIGVSDVNTGYELLKAQKNLKNFIRYILSILHIYPLVVKQF